MQCSLTQAYHSLAAANGGASKNSNAGIGIWMKTQRLPRLLADDLPEPGRTLRNYLRAAQAYMLISMPTGTSTIFGVFQVIWVSHVMVRHSHQHERKTAARSTQGFVRRMPQIGLLQQTKQGSSCWPSQFLGVKRSVG